MDPDAPVSKTFCFMVSCYHSPDPLRSPYLWRCARARRRWVLIWWVLTSSNVPFTVSGIAGAVAVAAGNQFSFAVLGDGTARCWGFNADGQLGDGTTTNGNVPVHPIGL